jgi:hypothetical protein
MLEKNQDRVELKDIKPEVLKEMLIYIYKDMIYCYDNIPNLLLAADKVCQLVSLKNLLITPSIYSLESKT